MADEGIDLQRKIEQVVGQTEGAEIVQAVLSLVVDPQLAGRPIPGGFQPVGNFSVGEAHQRRFIEVIQQLAVQAVGVDLHGGKVALPFHTRLHQSGHMVLGGFHRQEGRLAGLSGETGLFHHQRPEQLDAALGQAVDGQNVDLAARRQIHHTGGLAVGFRQAALGREHQNLPAGNAAAQQASQAFDRRGCLSAAGRTADPHPGGGMKVDGSHGLIILADAVL